jgi:dTDP-glucose 4,6-dehydratase
MRLLIAGGCGFIGSNFVRFVLEHYQPEFVTSVDALTGSADPENLAGLAEQYGERYEFLQCDIADREAISRILSKHRFYAVLNSAVASEMALGVSESANFLHANIAGTEVLLEAARNHGVKRFVQVSTDEVYGPRNVRGSFSEESPVNPSSPFSASKASADLLAFAAHRTFGQEILVARACSNYGPYQSPRSPIPSMIINALSGQRLPVYEDDPGARDWIHVEDHCRALMAVLLEGRPGEAYNIGADVRLRHGEIAGLVAEHLGKPRGLVGRDQESGGDGRAVDSSKIRSELGWKPLRTVREGLAETVAWYAENRGWWERRRRKVERA